MRMVIAMTMALAGCGEAGADDERTIYAAAVTEVGITEGACDAPVEMDTIPPLYTVEECVDESCAPIDYYIGIGTTAITGECEGTNERTVIRVRWVR